MLASLTCTDQDLLVDNVIIAKQGQIPAVRDQQLWLGALAPQSVDGVFQDAWLPGTTLLQPSHLLCWASTQLSNGRAKRLQFALCWHQASAGNCSASHSGCGDAAARLQLCFCNLMVTEQQLPSGSSAAQGELPAPAGPAGQAMPSTCSTCGSHQPLLRWSSNLPRSAQQPLHTTLLLRRSSDLP